MSNALRISLKAGERIYINGAVLRTDRKVTLELLNEVTFLLEHHVMKPEETSTPLRQLYFMVQTMMIDPVQAPKAREMCVGSLMLLGETIENKEILAGLATVAELIDQNRTFEALRHIRKLLPVEAEIMGQKTASERRPLEIAV